METLNKLFELDITAVIMGIFIILSFVISVYEILQRTCEIFNLPIKWIKKKNKDHELILQNSKQIQELAVRHDEDERKSQEQNAEIENKLNKLTDMVLKKEIEDSRWIILDFASVLSNGRKYNREAFNHIFQIYRDYENVLKEHNMTNGLVDESMEFVREKFRELLKNGELD